MVIDKIQIIGAIQSSAVASTDDRTMPSDDGSRPTFQPRGYLGTTRFGVDLNWSLNKILDVNGKDDYMRSATVSDTALSVMQDILGHIREANDPKTSLPAKDFETVCACVLNNTNSRPEQKIKAVLMLGEYYSHYKETEKTKNIYKAVMTKDTISLGDMEVVDDRRDVHVPVKLAEKLTGVEATDPYELQATARYHDLENRGAANRIKLDAAISDIVKALNDLSVSRENQYCFIESYSILAKLLAATRDPKLEVEALKITAMLRSRDEAKKASLPLEIDGKAVDFPWVNASEPGAKYFRTSAGFTKLQILDRKESRTPKEEDLRLSLMAEISAPGSMADDYMKVYIKFQRAEDFMKAEAKTPEAGKDNKKQAATNYLAVINDRITDPHMKGHASANYGTTRLALKDYGPAVEVFKALLGLPSTAANISRSNDLDIIAQAKIGLAEAGIELAGTKDEKLKAKAEAKKVMEEILLMSDNIDKSTGKPVAEDSKLNPYTFERASLDLADALSSSKDDTDKERALNIYSALLDTASQPQGPDVKEAIDRENKYNLLRAKLGKAQMMSELKGDPKIAEALYEDVIAKNTSDEAMQARAMVGLAELHVLEPATAARAEELFLAAINGPGTDPYLLDRARLGIQRSILAQPEKRNADTKSKAISEFIVIADRKADERLVQSALIEKASLLSENEGTGKEAAKLFQELSSSEHEDISKRAKIENAILDVREKDKGKAESAVTFLTAEENFSGLAPFFREKASLALGDYYARIKETSKALDSYNEVTEKTGSIYLKACALIGRAGLKTKGADKKGKEDACADYVAALGAITLKNGIPSGFRLAEILANKGLTNVAGKDGKDVTINGIRVKSRQEILKAYASARDAGEVEKDKYLESDILFDGLDKDLADWDHNKGKDASQSGKIINNYQRIIDGEYDDSVKNHARVNLVMALRTMGQPEEAQKVLAQAVSADIKSGQITEIDMAEVMNNYGFMALGDSDFNLGYEYFRKASEFDKDSPNSIIYRARAAFLTEKLSKEFSMEKITGLYNEALDKVWTNTGHPSGERPSIEEIAQAALSEDKTKLNEIANTPEGRFMALTALEAQAKIFYANGNSLKSAQCFEKAKGLFKLWKGSEVEMTNDYLFEYQLHYDLASVYLSLPNRLYDAYNEYKLISEMRGVPNWFTNVQMQALDPEQITVTASDKGDMNLAYQHHFEKAGFGVKITEDGASADTYLLFGKDKSNVVKAHLGVFNHGVIDAGIGYSKDLGRVRVSTGVDYNKDAKTNEIIGINAAAEFRVNRYLTLGIDGKYELHNEVIDDTTSQKIGYGTYEIGASANYVRRFKDVTVAANARIAYGTQRDYSVENSKVVWEDQITTPPSVQSDWTWDTPTSCYTTNSGSNDKFRQRYWITYNVYDVNGKPMSAWHISTAIEPETKTVTVPTPVYGKSTTENIDVPLNDLYTEGFAHMEGTSVVFNDSRNAILTTPEARPSSLQIDALDVSTLTNDAGKPRVQIHKESYTTSASTGKYKSATTIKIIGQNRITPEGVYPSESDPWGPEEVLYTLEVSTTKDPSTGLSQKTVYMISPDGTSKLLYQGSDVREMNDNIKAAIEGYYKASLYAGITKKFHGTALPDGTEITVSGSITGKYIPGNDRLDADNNFVPAKQQVDLTMGPRISARVPAGNGYFNAGFGYIYNGTKMNTKDDNGHIENKWVNGGWKPEAYLGFTANLSGNDIKDGTRLRASVGTSGTYLGVSRGPVNAGIGTGGPQVGVNANLKLGNTQLVGDLPISVSATGVNVAGLSVASAVNPITLGVGSVAKSITDTKAIKAIEKERVRLEKEISDAQNSGDKETVAYLRFIYDNLFVKEGSHQANWLKDSTRIPVLNLLTALTGTRSRKNAGSIIEETRQITGHFSALKETGAFDILHDGDISDATRQAITEYLANKTDYQGQKKGNVTKIADAQDKVVKGALTPFRLVGKALHLTKEKLGEGCVAAPSFKVVSDKSKVRHRIVEELISGGYIEAQTGKVTEAFKGLANASSLNLSEKLKDKQQMVFDVLTSAVKETKIGTVKAPAEPKTDEELKVAFNKKLREDSMYLVYRTIAEKGSTPASRTEIAQTLLTLPQDIRTEVEAFIDNLPVDVKFRPDKTVKVAIENEAGKDKKVKVTPEIYTKSVMQGESYSGKLQIEKGAIEEFNHGKSSVEKAFSALTEALSKATDTTSDLDNDKINDAVYKSALVLFMLAADNSDNADAVAAKMKGLDKEDRNLIKNGMVRREELSSITESLDSVWKELVDKGYIHNNGALQDSFKGIHSPEGLLLGSIAIREEALSEIPKDLVENKDLMDTIFARVENNGLIPKENAASIVMASNIDAKSKTKLIELINACNNKRKVIFLAMQNANGLMSDISDFILNRRPGATKIFGGQKNNIKVVNNSISTKDQKFTVEEFIGLAISGKLENEMITRSLYAVSPKDFKKIDGLNTEELMGELESKNYINNVGVIQPGFRELEKPGILKSDKLIQNNPSLWSELVSLGYINDNGTLLKKPLENSDLSQEVFNLLNNAKSGSVRMELTCGNEKKIYSIIKGSHKTLEHAIKEWDKGSGHSDKQGQSPLQEPMVTQTKSAQLAPVSEKAAPVVIKDAEPAEETAPVGTKPAKIDDDKPVAELVDKTKEDKKAAKAERIRKAQERYRVGPNRS
ncbi:MAG: hypothetical protein WC527_03685 [Candidatus Margulisiibacteriota bacterium]